ncbi:MAG: carbamoyltransferase HypF, partial [Deferribacterota bacterium]|nr:carbamoyltransferase HypF [Deferribacterota bacterium]
RIAVAYLVYFLKEKGRKTAKEIFKRYNSELELVMWQLENKFNTPLVGGCGRLFDAVAAFLGICHKNSYEGQAAIMLSHLAWEKLKKGMVKESYDLPLKNRVWQPAVLWEQLCSDYLGGVDPSIIAAKFHYTIGEAVVTAIVKACHKSGLKWVALSGGVWQNVFLSSYVSKKLRQKGLKVLQHRLVPPNDGGLCLGQALIAAERG